MTTITHRAPVTIPAAWIGLTILALCAANAARFGAVRAFLRQNLDQAPDRDGMDPGLVDSALAIGAGMGLALASAVGILIVVLAARNLSRATAPGERRHLPWWLSGVLAVGLVVPDMVTAATGAVVPYGAWQMYVVYLPLVALAVWAAPAPKHRGLRVVDVLAAALLPLV